MARAALTRRLLTAKHTITTTTTTTTTTTARHTLGPGTRSFSAAAASHPSSRVQIYISRSTDPYLNLSIEHFLLQKSHPDSVVLLLYTNRPCIVIGRNQNPWVEVNLGLIGQSGILARLRAGHTGLGNGDGDGDGGQSFTDAADGNDDVLLVRRRSGGGTVFHDAGNVNYSVICPPAAFDRDQHAEMVARALRSLSAGLQVRVNERHDIVLDTSGSGPSINVRQTGGEGEKIRTFKISGSAYKLTSKRSLHHGTCLLSSPHLPFLGRLLRSPAAPYIKARGVESVRSPVRNVGVPNADFEAAVVFEFRSMYASHQTGAAAKADVEIVDAADVEGIPEVQAGVAELRSRDWIYAQTPQFHFSTHPTELDPRPRPQLPDDLDLPASFYPSASLPDQATPSSSALQMTIRHAKINGVETSQDQGLPETLTGLELHHIDDWRDHVGAANKAVGRWLNGLFGLNAR